MGKNFFEHEINVKCTESLLAKESNWQWLINIIEEDFDEPCDASDLDAFNKEFHKVAHAFQMLVAVYLQIPNAESRSSVGWVSELIRCAKIRSGEYSACHFFESNFFTMLALSSHIAFLVGLKNEFNYLIASQFFNRRNLHRRYDLSMLEECRSEIKELMSQFTNDAFAHEIEVLKQNLDGIDSEIDTVIVSSYLDKYYDSNLFSFKEEFVFPNVVTWEEELLYDLPRACLRDGRLIPFLAFGNTEQPPLSTWSAGLLSDAACAFEDQRAICMLETASFLLNGTGPSKKTIEAHIDLFSSLVEKNPEALLDFRYRENTSLTVLNRFLEKGRLPKEAYKVLKERLGRALANCNDVSVLEFCMDNNLPIKPEQKELVVSSKSACAHAIPSSDNVRAFQIYLRNLENARYCDQDDCETIWETFFSIIETLDSLILPTWFYEFLQFLIKLQENRNVESSWAHQALIVLQKNWEEQYFSQSCKGMTTISQEAIVSKEELDQLNQSIIVLPAVFARMSMDISEDAIVKILEVFGETAITILCQRHQISERFPYIPRFHPSDNVDKCLRELVDGVSKRNSYRFLNSFRTDEIICPICLQYCEKIQYLATFIDANKLYCCVCEELTDTNLLTLDDECALSLGHITQLFPLLENKIRELGTFYNITPFSAKADEFVKGKSPKSVLSDLLTSVFNQTETFEGADDLLYVYFAMYSDNGLNIRNECIHGISYQRGEGLRRAFNIALVSLWIIVWRLKSIADGSWPTE